MSTEIHSAHRRSVSVSGHLRDDRDQITPIATPQSAQVVIGTDHAHPERRQGLGRQVPQVRSDNPRRCSSHNHSGIDVVIGIVAGHDSDHMLVARTRHLRYAGSVSGERCSFCSSQRIRWS